MAAIKTIDGTAIEAPADLARCLRHLLEDTLDDSGEVCPVNVRSSRYDREPEAFLFHTMMGSRVFRVTVTQEYD